MDSKPIRNAALAAALLLAAAVPAWGAPAQDSLPPTVPATQRGRLDAERAGQHDANNIRTTFWNYGMVGDYPQDPGNVDLSVFHSMEAPKGSGMNYSDGCTPFVLAKIRQKDSTDAMIMETGFRERQGTSPRFNRVMRFEPRPGFFQADPTINRGRSPAMSHDSRTWPTLWPDKLQDPDDPGWSGSWNGYFGKRPAADQESFTVMDDNFYDAWNYQADSRDATRYGLGLRVEVRGFQWSNPQAGNVIFWHYDITNESTTFYDDNIIFGLYMDSGVGGSALSCDGVYESDDDNAFFDKSSGLNLVYTWDRFGHGSDLKGNCSPTGYLGYAYLETPGNSEDRIDNDDDGIVDESRSSGPVEKITGQAAIRAYVSAHYDLQKFQAYNGPLENRPAYKAGVWWTGDEDMDWSAETDDVGADGVPDTHDLGEGDGTPTSGEPNFDKTDIDESDMIGLTGFKMNRIKCGQGNDNCQTDDILFFSQLVDWPERLYSMWTDPDPAKRFDSAVAANYNIGFLFASGTFKLRPGQHERFSLALSYGADLTELRNTVKTVKLIYAANYQFATPPPLPTLKAEPGDHFVRLSWDDLAERGVDPVVHANDFEGYRVYRSTDPDFLDPRVITDGRGTGPLGNGKPIAQFDLKDGRRGYSNQVESGVAYWLGDDTGITHTWTDTTVTNGQLYYYAVTSYDYGPKYLIKTDSVEYYPSENSISVSRSALGGLILPSNADSVRPNPRAPGFVPASAGGAEHVAGDGHGTVSVQVVNSDLVPDGHVFKVRFLTPDPDSIRAVEYTMEDSSAVDSVTGKPKLVIAHGNDLEGLGVGVVGAGLLPVIAVPQVTTVDSAATGFRPGGPTNARLKVSLIPGWLPPNRRSIAYPSDISIVFDSVVVDTSYQWDATRFPARRTRFQVIAHGPDGDHKLKFRFKDADVVPDGRLNLASEEIDVITYASDGNPAGPQLAWKIQLDLVAGDTLRVPTRGDVFDLKLRRPLGVNDVYRFVSGGQKINGDRARAAFSEKPYVVPNPYIGSASFEPQRFAVSGRGDRRLEFRAVPSGSVIRIYNVRGQLVQTLRHDGSTKGYVAWNLRTKDALDVAPGLYIFHVDAPGVGKYIGKFAVIK